MLDNNLIDFARLEHELPTLRTAFRDAVPFQHVVIDRFLGDAALASLRQEAFYKNASTNEKSSDLIFAKNKIENPKIETISTVTARLREELLSDRFKKFLSELTQMEVFVDPNFTGGGLHQGGQGSFLEMHADFTRHPTENEWIRELNILLYLNPDYNEAWGGCLDLEHADTGARASIAPLENRAVVMLTKPHTLHGYKAIRFPVGRFRTSIAAYAYSIDDGSRDVAYASTTWAPRSGFKRAMAGIINPMVALKQKVFGSRTARRARR